MNKKEVAEIKRRLKKESCTIQHMCGCYVDAEKNKLVTFSQKFLNLEEDEFYKYLEIAGKALSGTLGNNLLELEFPIDEEAVGGRQQILMALRASKLEDDALLDTYYDLIIDSYDYVGNYLITLYYDVYDVPLKGTDELAMDESDEVYEYLLCCICPVALSKPGLGYLEGEHRIGARIRDWVVGPTDTAFLFPAFNGRATDIHSTLVYTKNAKEPHAEFWANGLGCGTKRTATQKRDAFENMVVQTLGPDDEETKDTVLDVQQNLNDFILVEKEKVDKDEPILLDGEMITEILTDAGISEPKAEKITASYESFFEDTLPDAQELLDAKAIKNNEVRVEKKQLQEKVVDLTKKLEDAGVITSDGTDIDVVVKVTPEKVEEIHTAFVDGKRCLVIPMKEDEEAKINGETMSF
ncbi:DUF4317 domain-containing protein [Roseburia sp. NSJ-9]|jgi:hypothetical protein|uniref:DUF4317 domain-containing protein n=1 Tax=Roseburia lenta TaxID=2763061 RepID=A0ABR7GJ24_9FIRM|nr:DUF4317 domain-containing protein [Roseburia lenta]MBC5687288.1 DUF4317 domain-containing protein [Roseburia lenta]